MSRLFDEFKNRYIGKAVDIDGQYGSQCVDLFNAWNRDYNGTYINCNPSGFAHSIAENKANNGILKYSRETAVNNMVPGTIVVYGNCPFAPDSHVCFFMEDNGNGTYKALQQNAGGRQYVTIDNNPYTGIIGAFIPNQIWEELYPPKPEKDEYVIKLEKELKEAQNKIKDLEEAIKIQDETILELKKENEVFKESNNKLSTKCYELEEEMATHKKVYECKKEGNYQIKLYEKEILYIK